MTATLSDDTILATHFGVEFKDDDMLITPKKSNDIGERMILAPQVLNADISDIDMKKYLSYLAKEYNVVVIVPSHSRYKFWEEVADQKLYSENILEGIEELKKSHKGLTVLINRYGGIDLPKNACRVLVLDSLPDVRRKIDKIKESALKGSSEVTNQLIQKIEQGMGRGIRSQNDYCVVMLFGKKLLSSLYVEEGINRLSPATRLQLELSKQLSKQLRGSELKEINEVVKMCLERNKEWTHAHRQAIISAEYEYTPKIRQNIVSELKAFNLARTGNFESCKKMLRENINLSKDKFYKGWLKQELASYTNFLDSSEAQEILKSAQVDNSQLLKPIEGIQYNKVIARNNNQCQNIKNYIESNDLTSNNYILKVESILEDLKFQNGSANKFEQAFKELAELIGFIGQRPEKEFNKGPDILWNVGGVNFFVIECKNEASAKSISKSYCNQLNGSIEWFNLSYSESMCQLTPIMIHPSISFDYDASPNENIVIIDEKCLTELKNNIRNFVKAVSQPDNFKNNLKTYSLLEHHYLTSSGIIDKYTKKHKRV